VRRVPVLRGRSLCCIVALFGGALRSVLAMLGSTMCGILTVFSSSGSCRSSSALRGLLPMLRCSGRVVPMRRFLAVLGSARSGSSRPLLRGAGCCTLCGSAMCCAAPVGT